LGEKLVADSKKVLMLRKSPFEIYYCFPEADVSSEVRGNAERQGSEETDEFGTRRTFAVEADGQTAEAAAFIYTEPTTAGADLRGYVGFEFSRLGRWLEEDKELIGHPRDPFARIDVRKSSRHVEVRVGGETVIDTTKPFILAETGLQIRYYIPNEDVRWDFFSESDTRTTCPYKGRSRYFSVSAGSETVEDAAWSYPQPLQDARAVQNTIGLSHEKLEVWVDGEKLEEERSYFTK
jgi:uncharacterized protein (DUF427 family)